jgi:hypothetical protein
MPRITSSTETLPMAQPTNSVVPTGGVSRPMPRLSSMTMPKCTGSMPKLFTTGSRIGVQISNRGARSSAVPRTSSMMFNHISSTYLLLDMATKNSVIFAGICIRAAT